MQEGASVGSLKLRRPYQTRSPLIQELKSERECRPGPEDPTDLVRVERAICELLSIVEITADSEDNVYRIFESLNNTGLSLSQADLLRNYVFMLLPTNGEQVYRKTWLLMDNWRSSFQCSSFSRNATNSSFGTTRTFFSSNSFAIVTNSPASGLPTNSAVTAG